MKISMNTPKNIKIKPDSIEEKFVVCEKIYFLDFTYFKG